MKIRLAALCAVLAVPFTSAAPASAGPCATVYDLPGGLRETVCMDDGNCLVHFYGGGDAVDQLPVCLDTSPLGFCTTFTRPGEVCALTPECLVYVTTGRPPGLCVR